jgi:hypothetical protein
MCVCVRERDRDRDRERESEREEREREREREKRERGAGDASRQSIGANGRQSFDLVALHDDPDLGACGSREKGGKDMDMRLFQTRWVCRRR